MACAQCLNVLDAILTSQFPQSNRAGVRAERSRGSISGSGLAEQENLRCTRLFKHRVDSFG